MVRMLNINLLCDLFIYLVLNCMNCLHMLLQVAIMIKCHATLLTHDVFGFKMNFMDMLTEIGVFSLAVRAFCLKKEQIE